MNPKRGEWIIEAKKAPNEHLNKVYVVLVDDANFILSKLELCNIYHFEEYVKTFRKYYFLKNPP